MFSLKVAGEGIEPPAFGLWAQRATTAPPRGAVLKSDAKVCHFSLRSKFLSNFFAENLFFTQKRKKTGYFRIKHVIVSWHTPQMPATWHRRTQPQEIPFNRYPHQHQQTPCRALPSPGTKTVAWGLRHQPEIRFTGKSLQASPEYREKKWRNALESSRLFKKNMTCKKKKTYTNIFTKKTNYYKKTLYIRDDNHVPYVERLFSCANRGT